MTTPMEIASQKKLAMTFHHYQKLQQKLQKLQKVPAVL
jgi:hypothetical protein